MTAAQMMDRVAREAGVQSRQAEAVLKLIEEGATVPFIARYRKEVTGELDEVAIMAVRDAADRNRELEKRREAILGSLKERDLLTPELEAAVSGAAALNLLEDIYLPYRPKRRTRGTMAREAGLEPLALWLLETGTGASWEAVDEPRRGREIDAAALSTKAESFVDPDKGVPSGEEALAGARDILAEKFNEHPPLRKELRKLFVREALFSSAAVKAKEKSSEAATYRDYFQWEEKALKAPSHRILAVLRGASEGFLTAHFLPPEEIMENFLARRCLGSNRNGAADQVWEAVWDGYRRLTAPSLENELKKELKETADAEAIRVFAGNLRELLLSSPLGAKRVLALDPGLRTGCKLVCLDAQGSLVHEDVIYPLAPRNDEAGAARTVKELCRRFNIEAVAVGNGTGGREAEAFCRRALGSDGPPVVMVNESGASVYSASEVARKEFPQKDVTVRGAVSIGRRLMDPLAELVKIDPKSIGVGQYQHDVDQKALKAGLDDVVLSCVNAVGVEVNTASSQLLSYVSGISPRVAQAICDTRETAGPFDSREALKKVSGLGAKAFEQAAGFLRIPGGKHPLDAGAVHPERYGLVEQMAADLGCTVKQLMEDPSKRRFIKLENYVSSEVGMPTLRDILQELEKPGRDPRNPFELFSFSEEVHGIEDLTPGMILPGVVTNVTAFGAFVDLGVHQDGLVHISQMADHFVKNPSEVVKVNQKVTVKVLEVDLPRRRIGLSMKGL
jgi:uncharacterized protein